MGFENKVVVITGAGSGLGEATAIKFATVSAKLTLIDIDEDNLNKIVVKCTNANAEVLKIVADVSKDDEVKDAVNKTIERYERIDVLVNCAGIYRKNGTLDADFLSVFDTVMQVNLRAAVAMTYFAAPALIENKGCIVNIASVVAKVVNKSSMSYNVSKAAVAHFTKSVALDLADKGVRVNCVLPGPVYTKILVNAGFSEEDSWKTFETMKKSLPLPHGTQAEEVAELVQYLASDGARSVTGAEFVIDAGYSLASERASIRGRPYITSF